jgi:hypothetical protein
MNRGSRIVAVAAAYAVALNTLMAALAGLVLPAAGGALELAVLCSAGPIPGPQPSQSPAKPQPLCPGGAACAVAACAHGALGPEAFAIIRPAGASLSVGYRLEIAAASSPPINRDGFARGPPAA